MSSIKASFQDAVFENEYMWVFDNLIQAICRINIDNFEMEIVSDYKGNENFRVWKIFPLEEKFYLTSQDTAEILVYDRKKQGDDAFCLHKPKPLAYDYATRYLGFFMYDRSIYLFPKNIDKELLCFDVLTQKYTISRFLSPSMREKLGNGDLILRDFHFCKGAMWFVLNRTGVYGKYNFVNGKVDLYQAESSDILFSGICFDGEQVWLTETDSSNVICEGKQLVHVSGEQSYWGLYPTTEGIFIPPYKSDKLIFVERGTFKVSTVALPLTEEERHQVINYPFYDNDNFIYLFPLSSGPLFVFDKRTREIQRVKLKCENYMVKCLKDKKIPLSEDEDFNFKDLLQFCKLSHDLSYQQENNKCKMGNYIWKSIHQMG